MRRGLPVGKQPLLPPTAMQRRVAPISWNLTRTYATRWPRPKPGTAERPPYRPKDPLLDNPKATVVDLPDEDLTFIHRPPSSAPSPLSLTTNPASPLLKPPKMSTGAPLPPIVRPSADRPQPAERLSDEKLEEMKKLRRENPTKYSRSVLAKMFGCTTNFVALKAALPKTTRNKAVKKRDAEHQASREKWSDRHAEVMAIRAKRKEFW